MSSSSLRGRLALAGPLALLGALGAAAPAGAAQHVAVDTRGLTAGSYYVEFTLTDGSGTGDGNSAAAVSNFLLTGGLLGAVLPPTTGDVTGSLGPAQTLTLKDDGKPSGGLADIAQAFQQFSLSSPASAINFDLSLTNTSVDTPTPDNFTFQILNSSQAPLATTGPTGIEMVSADYTTASPSATGYQTTTAAGFNPPVKATVTPAAAAVPEPAPLALLGLGLLPLGLRARRQAAA